MVVCYTLQASGQQKERLVLSLFHMQRCNHMHHMIQKTVANFNQGRGVSAAAA